MDERARHGAVPVIAGVAVLAGVLGVGYAFAAALITSPQEAPEWLVARPIAHRGLHTGDARVPENSLAAFRAAADGGHPLELDVHLSADGVAVVFHDATLERMTGDPRPVAEVTSEELAGLRLLGSDEHVPTLADVLALVEGRVPVLVEIKQRGEVGVLERAVLDDLRGYPGEYAIQSFNPYTLAYVRTADPRVVRGQLSGTFADEDLPGWQVFALRNLLLNWTSRPAFIAFELEGLPTWGTSLQQARGRPLLAWTPDDPESFERAQRLCDGIIFDPGAF